MTTHVSTERTIFLEAIEKPSAAQREAFVQGACLGNPQLEKEVRVLLRAHLESGDLLDAPAAILPTTDQPTEHIGTLVGRYKLLEQVGEGGMGIVFVAEQTEPVRRRVALKIIKPGMDSRQVIARFEAERQALAMMDHPNIAKILDAGMTGEKTEVRGQKSEVGEQESLTSDLRPLTSSSGRPYFVMELVRGMPITEYCDKAKLSPRQRLELFVDVCQAVQHAHQKGIIHRDLKPSNVMVTMQDGRPVVKVIDFGVAKAVGQQLTERTVYTALTQLVGTPLYMSPEQAELTSHDIDTRSDVYSLGVLLYELLTGQTPFDKEALSNAGFDEMRRMIREDEPPRPSRRFSTLGVAAISTASQHRGLDERRLSKILSGELDWIVMKALEKDRSRRYESASTLAADIQRYLSDEPVLACPPTTMYRFQKFARKHKPAFATAAVIAACLILGTTVSAWQAVRATTAEAQATANEQKANANAASAQEKEQEAIKQRDEVKALADKLAAKDQQLQRTLYAAHMNLARTALDERKMRRVQELLKDHLPQPGEADLRGFEWHYLNRLSQPDPGPLASFRFTYVSATTTLSPDGTRLLAFLQPYTTSRNEEPITREATLKVFNLQTGQEELSAILPGDGRIAHFSPDATRLATVSFRRVGTTQEYVPEELKVWDTQTGKEAFSRKGLIGSVVFSPDSKLLAFTEASAVMVWDTQTGQERATLQVRLKSADALAFSPDAKRLAAATNTWDDAKDVSVDSEIKIWDLQTLQEQPTLKGPTEWIDTFAFSPSGQHVASGMGGTVKLWNCQTGKDLMTFKLDAEWIQQLAFNADGTRLITGGVKAEQEQSTRYAKMWNTLTGEALLSCTWNPPVREPIPSFADQKLQFTPDGKRVIAPDQKNSKTTQVFDAETGQLVATLPASCQVSALSPDSKRLAIRAERTLADRSSNLQIFDLKTGDELNNMKVSGRDGIPEAVDVRTLAFSPDGKRLIAAGPRKAEIWDTETTAQIKLASHQSLTLEGVNEPSFRYPGAALIAFSPDFTRLAAISGKAIKIFDPKDGRIVHTIEGHQNNPYCVAFSPDGKRLASSDGVRILGSLPANLAEKLKERVPGVVKLWDVDSGRELQTFAGHDHVVLRLAFSPDGRRLAGVAEDTTVIIWDTQTGNEIRTILKPVGNSTTYNLSPTIAFSPDGLRVASLGRMFDAQSGDEQFFFRGGPVSLVFNPDGKRMVSTVGGVTTEFDAATGAALRVLPEAFSFAAYSSDGKRLVGGGKIWDAHTGQQLFTLDEIEGNGNRGVFFSRDGHRLAIASSKYGQVTIYDATPLPEKP